MRYHEDGLPVLEWETPEELEQRRADVAEAQAHVDGIQELIDAGIA